MLINEDDEAKLASFHSHVSMGGYNVENDTANTYVYKMIEQDHDVLQVTPETRWATRPTSIRLVR